MKPLNKRSLIFSLLLLIPVATLVFADVVYVYTGNIQVGLGSVQPLTFTYNGKTAGPNGNVSGLILFQGSNTGFTVKLNITNSSGVYFYEAGYLTVNKAGHIYVNSISTSGDSLVQNMTIYIQNSAGSTVASFPIIVNGAPATTPSSVVSLGTGTYYISIYVVPNTPLPAPSSGSTETITVNFGYNLVSNATPVVP